MEFELNASVAHQALLGQEPVVDILSIAPETQKKMTYVLKILQASSGLAGAQDIAKAAKTLSWGVRCIGYVRTNPMELLEKLHTIEISNAGSLSQFLVTLKKTSDYVTIPPRLLNALCNYGILTPSVNLFSGETIQSLSGMALRTKQLCGLVAIIESVRGLQAEKIKYTQVANLYL